MSTPVNSAHRPPRASARGEEHTPLIRIPEDVADDASSMNSVATVTPAGSNTTVYATYPQQTVVHQETLRAPPVPGGFPTPSTSPADSLSHAPAARGPPVLRSSSVYSTPTDVPETEDPHPGPAAERRPPPSLTSASIAKSGLSKVSFTEGSEAASEVFVAPVATEPVEKTPRHESPTVSRRPTERRHSTISPLSRVITGLENLMREVRPEPHQPTHQEEADKAIGLIDEALHELRRPSTQQPAVDEEHDKHSRLVISDDEDYSIVSSSSSSVTTSIGSESDIEMVALPKSKSRHATFHDSNDRTRLLHPRPVDFEEAHGMHRAALVTPKRVKTGKPSIFNPRSRRQSRASEAVVESPAEPRHRRPHFADDDDASPTRKMPVRRATTWRPKFDEDEPGSPESKLSQVDLRAPRKEHHSFRKDHQESFYRQTKKYPVGRNWSKAQKYVTAIIACLNTSLVGFMVGIYAGEVPRIQYQLADEVHQVILGNMYFFFGMALTTFLAWPLPLLHGRKVYTLAGFALAMPLQFPQALVTSAQRSPLTARYRVGLLLPRFLSGLACGFANVNFFPVLLDLFGASLQSKRPHQELTFLHDIRRHGGGIGIWLGYWTFCFTASIAIGFFIGAGIINDDLNPAWGFYVTVILIAFVLIVNLLGSETRKSPWRRTYTEFMDKDDRVHRRVARGEVRLHYKGDGPKFWYEEVWAGIQLSIGMLFQPGFFIMASYLGWLYSQIILLVVLLGALLSREYRWTADKVGLGVFSIAIGALLAIPLTKAGWFSRGRKQGPRTDSMTIAAKVSWSSHMLRRILFMVALPFFGLAYTLGSAGRKVHFMVPIIFAGAIGFVSNLAIAECYGIIMETFDTCDLQPGANSRHRLESLAADVKARRTSYTAYPRVTAGIFVSQVFGFIYAGVATAVGGAMTRQLGAQTSTAVTAGMLFILTLLLIGGLYRWKEVQVIPNSAYHTWRKSIAEGANEQEDWAPVVLGNPSGKMRRVSILELGKWSRWSEVRRLNKLLD